MRKAFTLAEVLITLGIIGVVAAMTLPTLINKYRSIAFETAFKKAYSNCAQALALTKSELGVDNLHQNYAYYDGYKYVDSEIFIEEYYKQLKRIGKVKYKEPIKNYTLNKNFQADGITCLPEHLLPDGSSICTKIWATTISVTVDINGANKRPNAFGHDIFMFRVHPTKDLLIGQEPENREPEENSQYPETDARPCSKRFKTGGNGLGCSYYALKNISPDNPNKSYWNDLP